MSTGIYYFEGSGSNQDKVIIQECTYDDPVTGPTVWRSITRIVDENTLVYKMFITTKEEKDKKMMEMSVTRIR